MKLAKVLSVTLFVVSLCSYAENKQITVKYGVDELGNVTKEWPGYTSSPKELEDNSDRKLLTLREQGWANLISSRLDTWQTQLDEIAVPYEKTEVPKKFTLVLGNRGGRDAFTHFPTLPVGIFFNLSVLQKSYGDSTRVKNKERIDRIFAHEFTHLLQSNWSKSNPYPINSHIEYALNEAYKEGFGHYRSISNKWKNENGGISEHAEKKLKSLETVFVERMILLTKATDDEAEEYLRDLAMGRFDKKWGALTVALWLTKEAQGNDSNLIKWVDLGPNGVIRLANKYLPEKLRNQLNHALQVAKI